ncbi:MULTISPECIES: GntR family transcriptional regulator [Ignatzschineria]|uniref:UTRA domain-containing protein n=1 Tax=Ignatzschineria cameli TaxID=2182793 RepID=A0A2U2ATK8_9GAMM|nr:MULTISPECIES: GntR family transcriptional regulator [Ignatzschineria]OYQ78692.1 hypothetical protein B9T19_07540 [Ignatzschineria sp. F8392]PWD87436.1 UTRA domain-containing protein [Ignatzschineria cameli]PWD88071.1 UTRA domain-containing protein [Ignatzschineria cameli]PWD91102.1 UTRA domain-containing protein [Ignatzschineria cameli]PWD92743.1 UTRA domain-containing protein [Ignatzschineria cameli]
MPIHSFQELQHSLERDDRSLPLYQKIKEFILEKIALREWRPHQKLPSENEISAALNVSRMTVNRAFKELTEEGYLFREKGSGTFVAEPFQLTPFFELFPISQEIAIEGNQYGVLILERKRLAFDEVPFASHFQLTDEEAADFPFLYSEILYLSNGVPIQYEKRTLLAAFAPRYEEEHFLHHCSSAYLLNLVPALSQKHRLEAIIPSLELQKILALDGEEACFKVIEKFQIQEKLRSYAEQFYPASRYQFHSRI